MNLRQCPTHPCCNYKKYTALLCDHDLWPRWSWSMSSMWSLSSPPRFSPRLIYCSGTLGESLETTRASPPTSWDQPGHCPPLKGSSIYDESLLHVQNFEYQVQVEIKVPVLFRRYIEVHGRPSPVTFLPATPRHPHQMLLRFVKSVVSFSTTSGYKLPQTKPDLFVDAKPTSFVLKRPSSNIYIIYNTNHQFTFV